MSVIYSTYEWNKWEEDKTADKKVDTLKIKFRISQVRVVIRLVCHTSLLASTTWNAYVCMGLAYFDITNLVSLTKWYGIFE